MRICQSLYRGLTDAPLRGRVHSVFTNAVNIDTSQGLVTLLTCKRSVLPNSIVLDTQDPFPLYGWERGLSLTMDNRGLFDSSGKPLVRLDGAVPVELFIYNRLQKGTFPDAEPITRWLREHAEAEGLSSFVTGKEGNPYTKLLAPRLPLLFQAVNAANAAAAADAAARIAGCGMGLTPSSDDLLCGYMATAHALCACDLSGERNKLLTMTKAIAGRAAEKTNRISAAFLLQSGNGYASQDLLRLFEVLFSGASEATVQAAAACVGSFGSTSGADILTGVVLALANCHELNNGGSTNW